MTQIKKAMALSDTTILGTPVPCGSVVSAPTADVAALVKAGILDDKKTAVEQGLEDGQAIKEILAQAEPEKDTEPPGEAEPAKEQTPEQPDTGGAT